MQGLGKAIKQGGLMASRSNDINKDQKKALQSNKKTKKLNPYNKSERKSIKKEGNFKRWESR